MIRTPEGVPFIPGGGSCVKVSLRLPDGEDIIATGMDGEGYYKFEGGIPAGDYELYVYSFGANNPYADSMPVPIHIEEGQTLVQDIYLTDPLITGYVFTPDGQPYIPGMDSGVNIFLKDYDGNGIRMGCMNEDGSYKLGKDIPAGDYFLYADTCGNNNPYTAGIPVAVHIVEGQPLTQDIYLTNPSVAGMVLTPEGIPFIPGGWSWVKVCLKSPDGKDITGTGINPDGSYKMPGGIPTGDYMLYAYMEGTNSPYTSAIPVAVHIVEGETLAHDIYLPEPSVIDTPVGENIKITDDTNGINMTFSQVESFGNTTIKTLYANPLSDNFQINSIPIYYEINSSATFAGDFIIEIPYDVNGLTVDESELRI
ncbi:MAG: carboxypeptidase-like regulatory domain-containing protein [Clostridiales bacterium]|nr:carboxypeptidase-like regulatory domain-containing protein [Clostridiales bacterium]